MMKATLKLRHAALAAAACWGILVSPAFAQEIPKAMRGTEISAEEQAPPVKKYLGGRPGSHHTVARTFREQPPVIPHAVENFDEISLDENQCLSCHSAANYKKKKAPKIGDSHFRDRDGHLLPEASSARYNCSQCHVPQVDAPPLVDNDFKGDLAEGDKAAGKKN